MSQPNLAYAGEVLKIVKITDSSYKFWNIYDLVLGLFFLSRPGIFIQSSSDLHGLMTVLNKKKNNDL